MIKVRPAGMNTARVNRLADSLTVISACETLYPGNKIFPMIKLFLQRLLIKNKALILKESINMRDFMNLLMKRRNTTDKWTKEEIHQIKVHVVRLAFYVPVLVIFVLPGGKFLLPFLAEVLDRREKSRLP
jgi:hypothetical protein